MIGSIIWIIIVGFVAGLVARWLSCGGAVHLAPLGGGARDRRPRDKDLAAERFVCSRRRDAGSRVAAELTNCDMS